MIGLLLLNLLDVSIVGLQGSRSGHLVHVKVHKISKKGHASHNINERVAVRRIKNMGWKMRVRRSDSHGEQGAHLLIEVMLRMKPLVEAHHREELIWCPLTSAVIILQNLKSILGQFWGMRHEEKLRRCYLVWVCSRP